MKVIFEDQDLLILDKPAGITVNNSETTKGEETVQDFVENKLGKNKADTDFAKRAGIVHRIDKETSGVLIVAKTEEAFENLQKQFKDRVVKKTYIALVHGNVVGDEGKIVVPVGRLPWNRKRFGVLAGGKPAETNYKVLERFEMNGGLTLLELNPKTGRTHQLRVHLKYFNHPIFADYLYAGRKISRDDRKVLSRVFLHAVKIFFNHPRTGEGVTFESQFPDELMNLLSMLRACS